MSARPLHHALRQLDGGAFLDVAGEKLAQLVKAIEDTGKNGKLTLTLELKRVGGGAIQITPSVKTSTPEAKPETTLLWATVEGNLTADNPNQQKLDLRSVEAPRGELKSAAG